MFLECEGELVMRGGRNCLIEGNTIVDAAGVGILIGDARNKDWKEKGIQNIPPQENQIIGNILSGSTGDLLVADHAPDNRIEENIFHQKGNAIISNSGQNPIFADPLK